MKKVYLVFLKQSFKQNVLFHVTNYKASYGGTEWQNWQPFHRAALPGTPRGWGQAAPPALPAAASRLAVRDKASPNDSMGCFPQITHPGQESFA